MAPFGQRDDLGQYDMYLVRLDKKTVLNDYFALILTKNNINLTEVLLRISDVQYGAV